MSWLSKLFTPSERRRSRRRPSPPVLAFYWDGEVPQPHAVPDISDSGLFLKTEDRWTASSLLRVTLQAHSEDPQNPGEAITVQCRVVRTGDDGAGMAIMLAEDKKSDSEQAVGSLATRRQFRTFLEHITKRSADKPLASLAIDQAPGTETPATQSTEQIPEKNQ